jgi:hypothetical protein
MSDEQSNQQLLLAVMAVQLGFADSDRVMGADATRGTNPSPPLTLAGRTTRGGRYHLQ